MSYKALRWIKISLFLIIVLSLIAVFITGYMQYTKSHETVVKSGQLIEISGGKTRWKFRYTHETHMIHVTYGWNNTFDMHLCGVGCKKILKPNGVVEFFATENKDGTITLEWPWLYEKQ